jgi:hypothetical protein
MKLLKIVNSSIDDRHDDIFKIGHTENIIRRLMLVE